MSIIETLKRIVDPAAAREDQAARKSAQEQIKHSLAGEPPSAGEVAPRRFRCRVCGHEAPDAGFCPTCLAQTMAPVPDEEARGPGAGTR